MNLSISIGRSMTIGAFVVVLAVGVGRATGSTPLVTHQGSNDPTLESPPWPRVQLENQFVEGPGTENGTDYWSIATVGSIVTYNYPLTPSALADPSGWTATVRMREVESMGIHGPESMFWVRDGSRTWQLLFSGNNANPAVNGLYTLTDAEMPKIVAMDPAADYHIYQLVHAFGSGTAGVYIDGAWAADITGATYPDTREIGFGEGSTAHNGTGHWAYASYQVGQNVVPEPTSIALLALGALSILRRRGFLWDRLRL